MAEGTDFGAVADLEEFCVAAGLLLVAAGLLLAGAGLLLAGAGLLLAGAGVLLGELVGDGDTVGDDELGLGVGLGDE